MKNFGMLKIIGCLLAVLIIVNSCDPFSEDDSDNGNYLVVRGEISKTLKYIDYNRDFGDIELTATDKSIYNLSLPFYKYDLDYSPYDSDIHQQFVKWTEDGFEGYFPLSIDFDYDEEEKAFYNVYARFCVYDTVARMIDSSRIITIRGLTRD